MQCRPMRPQTTSLSVDVYQVAAECYAFADKMVHTVRVRVCLSRRGLSARAHLQLMAAGSRSVRAGRAQRPQLRTHD
jgi:hypothetical protein